MLHPWAKALFFARSLSRRDDADDVAVCSEAVRHNQQPEAAAQAKKQKALLFHSRPLTWSVPRAPSRRAITQKSAATPTGARPAPHDIGFRAFLLLWRLAPPGTLPAVPVAEHAALPFPAGRERRRARPYSIAARMFSGHGTDLPFW
jgi:hypothetical protein